MSVATWNTRSLTQERFSYCKNLGYDVLAITELWRSQGKYQNKSTAFIASEPILMQNGPRKGQPRFPEDRASGVGILLSKRAQDKLLSFGSQGERVCYVRLQGPTCNLFVIAIYVPHRGRTKPCQDDTLKDLEAVLKTVPASDCICIAGDFNEQVAAGVEHRTGKWTPGPASKNADKIMQLMQLHNLTAINTFFKPRHKFALNTFLQTMRKDSADSDQGEYVGRRV